MIKSNCLGINQAGHLTIGGVDTVEIVRNYQTPCYVMDEQSIRSSLRKFKQSIEQHYNANGLCLYASKAMCCKEMCRIVASEGCGLDVVSGGELLTAVAADFPMDRVFFHGNNKTDEELDLAIQHKVGRIVVDNIYELNRLSKLCQDRNLTTKVYLRITPGISAHTHEFIRTGEIDSKFGFTLHNGDAMAAVKQVLDTENVELMGLHCHIGSQIFQLEPFAEAAKVMITFIRDIKEKLGYEIEELDLGGGFGIQYVESDTPREYDEFMKPVSDTIHCLCEEYGVAVPRIMIEPGRSIAAPAGITLYTAGSIKNIPGIRKYVAIDGGMTDNPRYILYQSEYEVVNASKANQDKTESVTIAGKCCESGDLIQENASVQTIETGDVLAVLATGAYNYSMASNYNRIPKPPVYMVNDGQVRLIVKGETYEDMFRNDI